MLGAIQLFKAVMYGVIDRTVVMSKWGAVSSAASPAVCFSVLRVPAFLEAAGYLGLLMAQNYPVDLSHWAI